MKYRNTVEFEVSGDYALFSDPVTRAGGEKSSLLIPTYEGIKGVLHSIYWKPTIVWIIDKVRVMNPIQTESKNIRTLKWNLEKNDLAVYTYLKDVRYRVQAHFEWNYNRPELECDRNENKHHNIAKRMIGRGGRRDIFLGTRECQGYVEPCVFDEGEGFYDNIPEMAFGFMYHGITYADEAINEEDKNQLTVRFWRPVMKKGVIEFTRPEDCTDIRHIREMSIKPFGKGDNFIGADEFEDSEVSGE